MIDSHYSTALCSQIPYSRSYRSGIADAFDIYLIIVRAVRHRVFDALGRSDPDWRPLYGCPACGYKGDSLHINPASEI